MPELEYTMDDIIQAAREDKEWQLSEEERWMLDFIDTFLLVL